MQDYTQIEIEDLTPSQLSNGSIGKFILAGNAIFTLKNTATGNRFTFKIRQPKASTPHFVSVLTGSDNTSDYTFLGTVFNAYDSPKYYYGKRSTIGFDAQSAKTIAWFLGQLFNKKALPSSIEVWHAGKCGRCGRLLTDPQSIADGIGPICIDKI